MLGRILIVTMLLCTSAMGHDSKRPNLNDFFNALKSKDGMGCCSSGDGTGLDDIDWDMTDGHYRVRLEGRWVDVPDKSLVTVPNLAERAMVWVYHIDGEPIIRCFMPGSMG